MNLFEHILHLRNVENTWAEKSWEKRHTWRLNAPLHLGFFYTTGYATQLEKIASETIDLKWANSQDFPPHFMMHQTFNSPLLNSFLLLLKLNCFYGLYRMEWMNETIWNNRAKSCKWDKNCIKWKQSESYFLLHSFVHLQLSGLTQNENDMNGHWTSNNHNFEERKHRHLPVLGYFFTHVSFAYGWMHELMS